VPREREPDPHPIVTRLIKEGSEDEIEDVVPLIGYLGPIVGPSDARHRHIYPELGYQRWLDLPMDKIVDTAPYDSDGRMVVWVERAAMRAPMFDPQVELEPLLAQHFKDFGMSTWPLLPDSRYEAAEMLDLLVRVEGEYS
jgi:hypothetical protein